MIILKVLLMFAMLLGLAGCATGTWVHPTSTTAQTQYDLADCNYTAELNTGFSNARGPIAQGIEEGMRMSSLSTQCMRLRGYSFQSN